MTAKNRQIVPAARPGGEAGPASSGRRPILRLHLSTWLAVGFLAVAFLLIAVPARPTDQNCFLLTQPWTDCWGEEFEHGWPWPYLRTEIACSNATSGSNSQSEDLLPPWMRWRNWRLLGDLYKFMPGNLLCDLAVILAALLLAAAMLEWRRRRLASPWQFTLRELFLATLLVACVLSWCMVQREQCRQDRAESATTGGDTPHGYTGPLWLRSLVGASPMGMFEGVTAIDLNVAGNRSLDDNLVEFVPHWKKYGHLQSLDVSGGPIGEGGLNLLTELPNLREATLCIDGSRAAGIGGLTAIERLTLCGYGIDDAVVARLGALPNLRLLTLHDGYLNGGDCACLRGLTAIEGLELAGTAIAGDALANLAELKNLRTLCLGAKTEFTEASLSHLDRLTNLTALSVSSPTDAWLTHIGKLTGLRVFVLDGPEITNAGIAQLKPLQNLRVLDVSRTKIDDGCAAHLARLNRLQVLDVSYTGMTIDGLIQLRSLQNLEYLLAFGITLKPADIKRLQDAMPNCAINPNLNPGMLGGMGLGGGMW
jgi:hypothetical protein